MIGASPLLITAITVNGSTILYCGTSPLDCFYYSADCQITLIYDKKHHQFCKN